MNDVNNKQLLSEYYFHNKVTTRISSKTSTNKNLAWIISRYHKLNKHVSSDHWPLLMGVYMYHGQSY